MRGFATWLLIGFLTASEISAAESLRPHIVLIVADDLRADILEVYGGPVATPHLKQLVDRGVRFSRATCGYPICHVSRTELMTGRSVVKEAASGKAVPFAADWAIWPQVMQDAGWRTVHAGKWHVAGTPWTRGYQETSGLYSSGGAPGQPLTHPLSATGRPVTGYTGWTFKTPENRPLPELGIGLTPQTDSLIADAAIATIQDHSAQQPLFLSVNFTAPHDPLHWPAGSDPTADPTKIALPGNFRSEHPFDHGNLHGRDEMIVPAPRKRADVQRERAVYDALAAQVDQLVGRVVAALNDRDMLNDTWIIFTSDQGMAVGSHGLMGKQNQYEHTANVPLILAGPGITQRGNIAAQCALRDLFPTVCELTGLPIPASVQGRSLLPLLRGEQGDIHPAIYGYFTDTQRMIRTNDGWKLIVYPQINRQQLFNTRHDPEELHDLSSDPTQLNRLQSLRKQLDEWLASSVWPDQ